jgi:NitT/TauT family transport system substrate-binding protein
MPTRLTVLCVLALTILSGCTSCRQPGTNDNHIVNNEPLRTTLRLKYIYDPGFAGEMVAAKAGFFQEKKLEVELKPGGFEADPIKLVAAGSDTFGVAGADSFLLAREKGVPIVAFAAGYIDTPVVFYTRKDSGISSPQDFVGKRVGYQAGQDTGTVYEALIRKAGVDRQKIKEVPVRFDFTPFLTKQVDVWPGYAATQSYILQRENIPYNIITPNQYGITYLGTVYFTSEKFMSEHPEAVQGFVDGIIKGWEYTYSNYDAAIPLVASYDEKTLTPDLIRFNFDKQKPSILPPGTRFCDFTMDRWEATQRILVDQKLLNAPVDLSRAVTTRFLDVHYNRGQ